MRYEHAHGRSRHIPQCRCCDAEVEGSKGRLVLSQFRILEDSLVGEHLPMVSEEHLSPDLSLTMAMVARVLMAVQIKNCRPLLSFGVSSTFCAFSRSTYCGGSSSSSCIRRRVSSSDDRWDEGSSLPMMLAMRSAELLWFDMMCWKSGRRRSRARTRCRCTCHAKVNLEAASRSKENQEHGRVGMQSK